MRNPKIVASVIQKEHWHQNAVGTQGPEHPSRNTHLPLLPILDSFSLFPGSLQLGGPWEVPEFYPKCLGSRFRRGLWELCGAPCRLFPHMGGRFYGRPSRARVINHETLRGFFEIQGKFRNQFLIHDFLIRADLFPKDANTDHNEQCAQRFTKFRRSNSILGYSKYKLELHLRVTHLMVVYYIFLYNKSKHENCNILA